VQADRQAKFIGIGLNELHFLTGEICFMRAADGGTIF
jgi:hypothetical protein